MGPKLAARIRLDRERDRLIALSHRIHAHPELAFEEERACGWLAEILADAGFAVATGICELPTAFIARSGSGPLHVAFCAEYDALPGVGHACGHNIIAAAAVGAGIAASRVADDIGLTVTVIGTPAEEIGDASGKVLLLERGAFAGLHAAMMVHPYPLEVLTPSLIAASMFTARYTGKAAHASAFPELGVNAADAMTLAQVGIGLLRQHILTTDRVHGIVTKGGDAPNIVPAHTEARYLIRSATLGDLEQLRPRVHACFTGGAVATGSTLHIVGGDKPYAQMCHDADLATAYGRNIESLGRSFAEITPPLERASASTDMGNVSLAIPSIHPFIGIDSLPAVNHQPEFAAHCVTAAADRAVIDASIAMTWTAIDAAANEQIRDRLLTQSRSGMTSQRFSAAAT